MKVLKQDAAETVAPGAAAPASTGLEAIAQQAEQLEAEAVQQAGEGEGGPPEAQPLPNAVVIAGGLAGARDVFCMFTGFESPKATMGPEQLEAVGAAWGAALDARGISLQDKMGGYALEIAAALATIPVAAATIAGVRAEMAARDTKAPEMAAKDPGAPLPPPAPGPGGVRPYTPGVIRPDFGDGR